MRFGLDEPYPEISRLRARLRELLDSSFASPAPAPAATRWTPPADIQATDSAVVVTLEVPGVPREALDAILTGRVLTVTGRRERVATGEEYYQVQRPAGEFSRAFTLGFEPREIDARLEGGVLTVTLQR
jgi:HSP20 family protein